MSTFYPGGEDPQLSAGVKAAEEFARLAREWAIGLGLVEDEDFSSKTYAQQAKADADRAEEAAESIQFPTFGELSDTTFSTLQDGQVAVFRSGQWVNENQTGGGGDSTLGGLLDVTLTTPTTGDSFLYVDGMWKNNPNIKMSEQGAMSLSGDMIAAGRVQGSDAQFGFFVPGESGAGINVFGIDTVGLRVTQLAQLDGGFECQNETTPTSKWEFTVDEFFGNLGVWNGNVNGSPYAINTRDIDGTIHGFIFGFDGVLSLPREPIGPDDAATKKYVDDRIGSGGDCSDYLPLTGGELTGSLAVEYTENERGVLLGLLGIDTFAIDSQTGYQINGELIIDFNRNLQNITSLTCSGLGDFGLNRIINVGDPVNPQDVVTKAYGDANYSGGAGGNHSTLLNLDADDHPQYLNQARGDGRYLQLTGGTITGGTLSIDYVENERGVLMGLLGIDTFAIDSQTGYQINGDLIIDVTGQIDNISGINMGSNRITSLLTPAVSTDAANKGYVDDTVAALPLGELNDWPDSKFRCAGAWNDFTNTAQGTLQNCVVTDLGVGRWRVTLSSGSFSDPTNVRVMASVNGSLGPIVTDVSAVTSTSFEIFSFNLLGDLAESVVAWVCYDQGA